MPPQPQTPKRATRPLWVIAVSLATIAICLVLMVVKGHLDRKRGLVVLTEERTEVIDKPEPAQEATIAIASRHQNGRSSTLQASSLLANQSTEPPPASAPGATAFEVHLPPALAAWSGTSNIANAIVGRVILRGTPPAPKPLEFGAAPPCATWRTNPPTDSDYIVGPNGELADVLVAVTGGIEGRRYDPPRQNFHLTFANCELHPRVSAVLAGQSLLLREANNTRHSVRFAATNNPSLTNTLRFPIDLPPASERRSSGFRLPEDLVRIDCAVHPWESAYVSALSHPFFGVTGTNGWFVIRNLPPGKYRLQARHPRAVNTNEGPSEISVAAGQIAVLDFTLDVANP